MEETVELNDSLVGKIVTAQATAPSLGGDTYRGLVVGALNTQTLWIRCPQRIEVLCSRSTAAVIPSGEQTSDELLMAAEFRILEKLTRNSSQENRRGERT